MQRRWFRISVFMGILITHCFALSNVGNAQLSNGAIIIPEFFEELYRVPSAGGTPIDLLDSSAFDRVPADRLTIADANTAYLSYFADLYSFDFVTGQRSFIDTLSFNPFEVTASSNGELVALSPTEVFRVDPVTGDESSWYTETFFTPTDAVFDSSGNLFLTEFFDAIGKLSPGGSFTKIGNFPSNKFSHLDLGPDGMLYLSTNVGASFYRVNPNTGAGIALDSDVFTYINDLQVDADGDILFVGEVDETQGVFRFDPDTKAVTTLVDGETVNGGFFNPLDIAIFSSDTVFASADFNEDGDVDGGDLAQLLAGYDVNSAGDTNGDSDTDGADLLEWQRQYTGSSASAAVVVPEPAAILLLLGFLSAWPCIQRRENRHVCA